MDRFLFFAAGGLLLASASQAAPLLLSPEVHPDRTVTFRLLAPQAASVSLDLEGEPRTAFKKDDAGLWSVTVGPLAPDYYAYSFILDGVGIMDPLNWRIQPNLLNNSSMLYVPGQPAEPWELQPVPSGAVHRHFYHSSTVGDDREYYVYTPPGYDPSAKRQYPVLYLLHGFSDDASAWVAVGHIHLILDNLIAARKAEPMLIVMPLGYGAPEIVARGVPALYDPPLRDRNYTLFRQALLTEVIPQVEHAYRVRADRESRAVAGLSMGGAESLFTGLNTLDRFAWIGAFSTGGIDQNFQHFFPTLDAKANARLRLLWIACGTSDGLFEINTRLRTWLGTRGVHFTAIDTPGQHTWRVWRRNMVNFLPLLFSK